MRRDLSVDDQRGGQYQSIQADQPNVELELSKRRFTDEIQTRVGQSIENRKRI